MARPSTPVNEMDPDMESEYDYTLKLRGMVPGPHKAYLVNPRLSRTIVLIGAYFQTELSKAEIVTNVIDSRWGVRRTPTTSKKRSASNWGTGARRWRRSSRACRRISTTPASRSPTSC